MDAICAILTAIIHPTPLRWHIDVEPQFGTPSSLDHPFVCVRPLAEFSTAAVENTVAATVPAR